MYLPFVSGTFRYVKTKKKAVVPANRKNVYFPSATFTTTEPKKNVSVGERGGGGGVQNQMIANGTIRLLLIDRTNGIYLSVSIEPTWM